MRDYDSSNDPVELDAPIFIFPDDEEESDSGSSSGLNFGKVSADKQEKEFVYMPFLDDDEKSDSSSGGSKISSLSFSKVKAAKKESEFIFMPFLNDKGVEETEEDDRHFHVRPDGTVFDEGMVLMPLSPLTDEDEESEDDDEVEQDTDTGIYVTDSAPGSYVPPRRPTQKKNSKNSKNGKKKRPPNGGSKSGKGNPAAVEEQFRAVMKNINPDVRRAAMRDPVQRAALEQAVRIALVQQAAQEAVAKTTGSVSGYASYMLHNPSAPVPDAGESRRSSRAPRQPQSPAAANVRGFQFSGFDSAPAEFNVGGAPVPQPVPQPVPSPAAEPEPPVIIPEPVPDENIDFASTLSSQAVPSPDIAQDPVLASLSPSNNANRTAPNAQQDPALSTLTRSQSGNKPVSFTSPAAIRAAMRAGIDISSLQQNNSVPAAASASLTQKQKLQDAVDTKRSGCLIWIIIIFFLFFVGLVTVAVWPALSTEKKYQNAAALMADGDYITASESFTALADYKDSQTKAQESIYLYATSLESAGVYDKAISQLLTIEDYPGASERLAECRYSLGLRNLNNHNYANAYEYLHLIPKYNDAGDLALQANYLCGMEYFDKGDFEDAAVRFSMYPDYQDSYSYWQTSMYNAGRNYVQKGVYASAYDCFSQLGGYSDAAYFSALSRYHMIIDGEPVSFEETAAVINTLANYGAKVDYNHNALIPARLSGMWRNNDTGYYISYQVISDVPTFKTNMPGGSITLENVFFADNILCYTLDGEDRALITIESFEPSNSVSPDLVNVYSYITESEISFIRIY